MSAVGKNCQSTIPRKADFDAETDSAGEFHASEELAAAEEGAVRMVCPGRAYIEARS